MIKIVLENMCSRKYVFTIGKIFKKKPGLNEYKSKNTDEMPPKIYPKNSNKMIQIWVEITKIDPRGLVSVGAVDVAAATEHPQIFMKTDIV